MSDALTSGDTKLTKLLAGLTFEAAVEHAKQLRDTRQIRGLLNIAGEHYHDEENPRADGDKYVRLLQMMAAEGVLCSISIKPTQIGQGVSREIFESNLDKIAAQAESTPGVGVELDMEQPDTMAETIDVFCTVAPRHPGCLMRLAIQAEFRSSLETAKRVVSCGGGVRLVRGKAYSEIDTSLIFENPDELMENYIAIAKVVPPAKLALATGNTDLLKRVYAAIGSENEIEHQYLLGLPYHDKVVDQLLPEGKKISLYMPAGPWEKVRAYVLRRNLLSDEEVAALDQKYGWQG